MSAPEPGLAAFVQEKQLARPGEEGEWEPLAGGVSSDIWRVETSIGTFCVKRALAQLRVAAHWEAPVERNAYEWAYFQVASAILPGSVPTPLARDDQQGLFAMAWLGPDSHRLWKSELLSGRVDPAFAAAVGDLLGRLHAATARDPSLPAKFRTDASFHALRLDAYLLEAARAHADVAPRLEELVRTTAETRKVLVHGDVSPKNILIGPHGPVLLDAEVAWFGDPAFDLAFCLSHLVIKSRIVEDVGDRLVEAAERLTVAYFENVDWEDRSGLEARAAALLPALALARVDGKSPLEYLDETQRSELRAASLEALSERPAKLGDAAAALRRRRPGRSAPAPTFRPST
jgi:aminoglycoside phosphotransferase (APT) family kinase protein